MQRRNSDQRRRVVWLERIIWNAAAAAALAVMIMVLLCSLNWLDQFDQFDPATPNVVSRRANRVEVAVEAAHEEPAPRVAHLSRPSG